MMPQDVKKMINDIALLPGCGMKVAREGARLFMRQRTDAGELPEVRKKMSRREKEKLFFAQKQECNGCHQTFKLEQLEVDEFIPASRGGLRVKGNIQLLCKECNGKKTNHTPSQEAKRTGVGITEQILNLPRLEDGDHNEET